ncbi:MAG: PTS system mannose/fructose/sorbose family transporter subunit IID, partial [Myxococcales bacterium]
MSAARLPLPTLLRVFWRSLFLQAAWNPQGMQNLGFAYALYPALKRLYPEPERLRVAAERHLQFFNCHPYAAALILGGAVQHEERIARGEEPAEGVSTFKQALMGPMAALGDGFFWLSLQPACGTVAVLAALFLDLWGILVYLLGYNVIHLVLRGWFFAAGYR